MPSHYQAFPNDIKVRPTTYLIEEFETYLIHSKVKTASPLFALSILTCLTFDALDYKIRLYQCLVLTAKCLYYRFLQFVGSANKTDIWVFIIKRTIVYISQSVVCHQNSFSIIPDYSENNPFDSYVATVLRLIFKHAMAWSHGVKLIRRINLFICLLFIYVLIIFISIIHSYFSKRT